MRRWPGPPQTLECFAACAILGRALHCLKVEMLFFTLGGDNREIPELLSQVGRVTNLRAAD